MFSPTDNPYKFKYLITGITGPGIDQVYLPDPPAAKEVLFKKEQKFVRPEIPADIKKWHREWEAELRINKDFVHPQASKISAFEDKEWKRSEDGVYVWMNGVLTYLTGFYWWYLTSWQTYFGYPFYRETDKELTYYIEYCIEDPDCYGSLLNTIRRYGKSSLFGAWLVYRASRSYNHTAGMQGEKEKKIKKFYNKMVLKPFDKLPWYYKPRIDSTSAQTNELKFDEPRRRSIEGKDMYDEDFRALESVIDYRSSGSAEYDGEILNSYYGEESGKWLECSIYSEEGDGTWDIIKPCLRKGRQIRGKAFLPTTVEFLDISDKGGKSYKSLFYDSDFNQRQKDGRTKSGLYAAFLPGDCAYEDFLDEWGHPMRDAAREAILTERESYANNPSKKAGLIRRYPLSIVEVFYVNPSNCEFNSDVLQDRLRDIDTAVVPLTDKIDLAWENDVRYSKVIWRKNKQSGWFEFSNLPREEDSNQVEQVYNGREYVYRPKNDSKYAIGFDPIQHRTNGVGSRPVALVKRKYDSAIDGVMDDIIQRQRAIAKYPYQTNKYIGMMHKRPTDPNILFERLLMICWLFGCSVHIEKQKDAVISYFHDKKCGDFVLAKYQHEYDGMQAPTDGTAATPRLIEEYTSAYSTYIDNFGHTIPFREQVEDALLFNPSDTTVHDYTVAAGFCELACKMKSKVHSLPIRDISDFMPIFDHEGNVVG